MTLNEFNASIRALYDFYYANSVIESYVYPVSLPRSSEFNEISLTSQGYNTIYETGLSLSHYNFLLNDLAYFQFSWQSSTEWALVYYPNPRLSGSPTALLEYQDLKGQRDREELDDEEFSLLASSISVGNYIPRVRFEYSERQYRPVRHPSAHFHIGMSGEDRWASSRKLSPRSFGLLIAKHYYPELWWGNSRFSLAEGEWNANVEDCVDERLLNSIQSDGVSMAFSEFERLTFHFNALAAGN